MPGQICTQSRPQRTMLSMCVWIPASTLRAHHSACYARRIECKRALRPLALPRQRLPRGTHRRKHTLLDRPCPVLLVKPSLTREQQLGLIILNDSRLLTIQANPVVTPSQIFHPMRRILLIWHGAMFQWVQTQNWSVYMRALCVCTAVVSHGVYAERRSMYTLCLRTTSMLIIVVPVRLGVPRSLRPSYMWRTTERASFIQVYDRDLVLCCFVCVCVCLEDARFPELQWRHFYSE
jgi:hypothetical protein